MKKILSIFVLSALLNTQILAATPSASEPIAASAVAAPKLNVALTLTKIEATAYVVKDMQSNQILAQKGLDDPIEPASLTKLMTAYLTFKALESGQLKPDQMLIASKHAWSAGGSRMFLEMNEPVSVSDLIKGLIVQSGNDAAITLAEAISGSEPAFAELMNAEAQRLGMKNTHFENATGLPGKTHLTTVNDLVTLSTAIIRDFPQYYPIFSYKEFTYKGIKQKNRNWLLSRDPDVDGLKTGHTQSAGFNLIASSHRNGRRVLSVVVGTSSEAARATESSKLLNYALQGFDTPKMYQANQSITQVKIYKGVANAVEIGFLADAYITFPHGQASRIKPVLETMQPVIAPVKKGQKLGVLKLMDGNNILSERDVVALSDVDEAKFFGRMWDSLVLWLKEKFA